MHRAISLLLVLSVSVSAANNSFGQQPADLPEGPMPQNCPFPQSADLAGRTLPVVSVDTPMPAPAWAKLERELLTIHGRLAEQWDRAYLRADGTTDVQFIHGGGTHAPDDFFEGIWQLPLACALGAPEATVETYWRAWKGSLKQCTAHGLFVNEMAKYLDWHHNGEHYEGFWLLALCIPDDPEYRRLSLKYASFYDGSDPGVPNYDPKAKVICSMNSGGAGPVVNCRIGHWVEDEDIVSAAGDGTKEGVRKRLDQMKRQLDVLLAELPKPGPNAGTAKKSPESREVTELRQAINQVEFWSMWLDCADDGPVNLVTTCFGTNAFLLTGDAKYKRRTMEYIDACARPGQGQRRHRAVDREAQRHGAGGVVERRHGLGLHALRRSVPGLQRPACGLGQRPAHDRRPVVLRRASLRGRRDLGPSLREQRAGG